MDAEQLQQLATNAELNHWPLHLGVRTDAEKVEYLARQLSEASDHISDLESQLAEREECAACEPCDAHKVE